MGVLKSITFTINVGALCFLLSSCSSDFDANGKLLAEKLNSSSGNLSFKPMMRADSTSVQDFVPDTFIYKNKPFNGAIVQYDKKERIQFEGFLKNGLADSTWKFYFATGGVRMEGKYVAGKDVGLWRNYYGYGKPKIDKFYDEHGYMLMRVDYFDNGQIKHYQNVKSPMFGDKERSYSMTRKGDIITIYVEDSVLMLKRGEEAEKIGKNIFGKRIFQ